MRPRELLHRRYRRTRLRKVQQRYDQPIAVEQPSSQHACPIHDKTSVLLVPPEALAGDVDPERVVDLCRNAGLVHRVRRRKGVFLAVDVRREADREGELALERCALLVGRGVHNLLLSEDEDPADAGHSNGGMLARGGVYGSLEL